MAETFGQHVRDRREALLGQGDKGFSLRQVAQRIDVEPSYLSKIERDEQPPSDKVVTALAEELGEDPDVLLALAGKISARLRAILCSRPQLFSRLIQEIKDMPDHAVLRLVREVRDGTW